MLSIFVKTILITFFLLVAMTTVFAQEVGNIEHKTLITQEEIEININILENSSNNKEILRILTEISKLEKRDYSKFIPVLINILKNNNDNVVLSFTSDALGEIGKDAISNLVDTLKTNSDVKVIYYTNRAISHIGKDAKDAVPTLIKVLKTNEENKIKVSTITALGKIGKEAKDAVPFLIDILKTEKDSFVFLSTVTALGDIGKEAKDSVPFLIINLKKRIDRSVLSSTATALGEIGEDAKDAIPSLENILKTNTDYNVLRSVLISLCKIGNSAIPILVEVIKTNEVNNQSVYSTEELFGNLGKQAKLTVPVLIEILSITNDNSIKSFVTKLLGEIGKDAKDAIPILLKQLKLEYLKPYAEQSNNYQKILLLNINKIIDTLIFSTNDVSANDRINKEFNSNFDVPYDEEITIVYQKINILNERKELQDKREELEDIKTFKPITSFINEHYYYLFLFILISFVFISWRIVFLVKPIWLISFHEYLWTNSLTGKFKYILEFPIISLISTIFLRPRTMDAWIRNNLEKVKTNFESKETVSERNLYIPVKVSFKDDKNKEFASNSFREVFDENQSRLLFYGDGGTGKTSLVCQMAKWGLNGKLFDKHYTLPVLIENNIEDINKAISLEIKALTNSEVVISNALLKALLRKKRLLLIVDGLSELNEETKQQVVNNPDINAVFYTSRNDEIKDISKIGTNNLVGGMVTDFLSDYIEKSIGEDEKNKLFDKTIFDYNSGDLKKLAENNEISVLMVKLYAEQMIAKKTGTIIDELPNNIPQLMIKSIKVIQNKAYSKHVDFSDVMKVSKIVAWESLKNDYRPIPVSKSQVDKSLKDVENGKEILQHLLENLKIVEVKGIQEDKRAFKLDPLAEYLAAIYFVEENSTNHNSWEKIIDDIKKKSEKSNIKGFVAAIKDSYQISENIDDTILSKLSLVLEKKRKQ